MKYWTLWKFKQKEMLLFLRQMWKYYKSIFRFIHLSLFIHIQWRCFRFTHGRVAQGKTQPFVAILWVHITTVYPTAWAQSSQHCPTFSLILPRIMGSKSLVQELCYLTFVWCSRTSMAPRSAPWSQYKLSRIVMAPSKQLLNELRTTGNVQTSIEKLRS